MFYLKLHVSEITKELLLFGNIVIRKMRAEGLGIIFQIVFSFALSVIFQFSNICTFLNLPLKFILKLF